MNNKTSITISTKKLVLCGILTAIVIVLQVIASIFTRFGIFSISLVLIPIVIGAATCGSAAGAWLGLIFGIVVLLTGDANPFIAVNAPGAIATVLTKGVFCGLISGLVYKILANKNNYLAIILAAIVCPIVNTGIFLLGCQLFFMDTISQWGVAYGFENAYRYIIFGMIGINFIVELAVNIILSPVIIRILNIKDKI